MNFEKIRKYADLVTLSIGASLLIYLFFRYVFIYALPFFAGWFIAFALRPAAAYLSPKLRIKERYLRLVLTVLLFAISIGAVMLGIWVLSREVWNLLSELGERGSLEEILSGIISQEGFFGRLFGDFGEYVADAFYRIAMSLLTSLGSVISGIVATVPEVLFFLLILIVASVYFSLGLEEINSSVKRLLPRSVASFIVGMKNGFLGAFLKYTRAYLLLLLITFLEMLVGLFLIRSPYPFVMAMVIALLDLLPVIGVGFVLIPWGVWAFIVGNTPFGIGLLVLFVVHTVLRQIIEPRIVGKNLGVHPILTLVFIYIGYSLFGFVGLLLVPVFTVLVNVAFGKKNTAEVGESGMA